MCEGVRVVADAAADTAAQAAAAAYVTDSTTSAAAAESTSAAASEDANKFHGLTRLSCLMVPPALARGEIAGRS